MNKFLARLDKRYVKICAYAGVTVVLTLAACLLLLTASPVFAKLWELICTVVEPIVYGAAISYVLNPLVTHVSHVLKRRKRYTDDPMRRRSAAVVFSVLLVLLVMLVLLTVLVLMVTHSITSLQPEQLQSLLGTAQTDFFDFLKVAQQRLEEWGLLKPDSTTDALAVVGGAADLFGNVVFAVIFGIYFLIDGPRVGGYIGRVAHALLGDRVGVDYGRLLADADHVFSGYFRGQGIDALVVGVLSGVILTAIGVPFAPVVGLLAGLGNLIPYVGGPVGFGSIALMCLPDAAWNTMIAGFVAMGVIMFVDANVINPKLLSENVEVHPVLVVAALIAGGAVGGIAGMLVAVPAAAFLKIQMDRWLDRREGATTDGGGDEATELSE